MNKRFYQLSGLLVLLTAAAAVLSSCVSGSSFGSYSGNYEIGNFTCPSDSVKKIIINWNSTDILITQNNGKNLTCAETDRDLDEDQRLRWKLEDGVLTIQFWKSGYRGKVPEQMKQLTLGIPAGTEVVITSSSGDVLLGGENDMTSLTVTTSSGDVKLSALGVGSLNVSTSSGDVECAALFADETTITTSSGNVTVSAVDCGRIDITTSSGDVVFPMIPESGAKISFTHGSGELHADEYTVSGGYIVYGDGSCQISVTTSSGDLFISN